MSKLWLPFYDLGGAIGPNQPNDPIDIELFLFLSGRLRPQMRVRDLPPISGRRLPGKPAYSEEWLTALVKYCAIAGYPVQLSAPNVIDPMSAGGSLIVAMNGLYHRFYPDEFMWPKFTEAPPGPIYAGTLPYHMLETGHMRSPWLGVSATGPGPQREMPFYDVNSVTYPDPSLPATACDPLVNHMLKLLCSTAVKPPSIGSIAPGASFTLQAIAIWGEQFQQLGWACSDYTIVQPTNGVVSSPSLIIPINYYVWEYYAYGVGGLVGSGYLKMLSHPLFPPGLVNLLKTNRESRYFKL